MDPSGRSDFPSTDKYILNLWRKREFNQRGYELDAQWTRNEYSSGWAWDTVARHVCYQKNQAYYVRSEKL